MANTNSQIQIRIDKKTKDKANKVFTSIGLDLSSAVRMFLKQTINTGTLPYEIRDKNGFTLRKAQELRESIREAEESSKTFHSTKELADEIFKDV